MQTSHFLSQTEIDAIISAGGTPWSLISKSDKSIIGVVKTRTLARTLAAELNTDKPVASVDKYEIPAATHISRNTQETPNPEPKILPNLTALVGEPIYDKTPEIKNPETEKIDPSNSDGSEDQPADSDEGPLNSAPFGEQTKTAEEPTPASTPTKVVRHKSEIENPVLFVWNMCDAMLTAKRKDVINACIAAGVANGTSRTQYQYWFDVNRARKLQALAELEAMKAGVTKS